MKRVTCDPRVIDVDGYVHLVDGKVICFESSLFNLSDKQTVKDLVKFADNLQESLTPSQVPTDDMLCVIEKTGNGRLVRRLVSLKEIPEKVQKAVKRTCKVK